MMCQSRPYVFIIGSIIAIVSIASAPCHAFSVLSSFQHHKSASRLATSLGATKKIGLFGGGTVGGGIMEIINNQKDHLKRLTGHDLEIAKLCVRSLDKPRDFEVPEGCTVTTDFDDLLQDESLDMIVEVMGGTTHAKDVVFAALKKGMPVVTANKALIAKHLPEIQEIISDSKVEFRYEAAVCGGIPIIRSLQSDFVGDDISIMSGIINGCTNFMLTSMDQGGMSYDEALAQASELGYAEADPTLDVGGFDARSKLRILIRLAFGVDVAEDEIACRGITELTQLDFQLAKMMGGTIKLIAEAKKVDEERVAAFVSPCYVTTGDFLSSVHGATNALEISSTNQETTLFIGQGAGRFPTANSCVNDIVALARGVSSAPLVFNPLSTSKKFVNNHESVFYIRLKYRDQVGITRQCGEVCEKYGVSIHSILQNPIRDRMDAAFVLLTEKVSLKNIKEVCAELEAFDWCRGPAFFMPVLGEEWKSVLV